MLTSIIYKKYLGYDEATNLYHYEYELTDDELGVHLVNIGFERGVSYGTNEVGIIKFYEERNLDVAANLARAILFLKEKYNYTLEDVIKWNIKYNPKYQKYHEEVQKYLMLL